MKNHKGAKRWAKNLAKAKEISLPGFSGTVKAIEIVPEFHTGHGLMAISQLGEIFESPYPLSHEQYRAALRAGIPDYSV